MLKKLLLTAAVAVAGYAGAKADFEDWMVFNQLAVSEDFVWGATNQGLYRYDKKTGESQVFSNEKMKGLLSVTVMPDGQVAVGAIDDGGIATFNGTDFDVLKFAAADRPQRVSSIVCHDGIWATCPYTVVHHTGTGSESFLSEMASSTISSYRMTSLIYDEKRWTMWYGASGFGLYTFGQFSPTGGFTQIEAPQVNGLYLGPDGNVYIASSSGMYCYSGGEKAERMNFAEDIVSANCYSVSGSGDMLCFNSYRNLVVGTIGGEFKSYSNSAVASDDFITSVKADGRYIWVAYYKGGLYLFDNGEFKIANSGVEGVEAEDVEADDAMYDLQGRRLGAPAKGTIYIQGGKKRVMR